MNGDRASVNLALLAYSLLVVATVPALVASQGTWAVVPLWLSLAGYVSSMLRVSSKDEAQAKRYADAAWVAYMSNFVFKVFWPMPMHWYDALAAHALLMEPGSHAASLLLAFYYAASAAGYATDGDVLQICGRAILAVATTRTMI
jgi:hypothetical protein